jgi:Lrp/AsnC family leucine-responsive transcriptional regulator
MLDDVSLKILQILQEKARIPNVEVARKMGMAPSAVLERIRKLEKQGYIDGYEVRLNSEKFSRSLVAFIRVRPKSGADEEALGRGISNIPEVQEVHMVTGEDGLMVKVRVSDTGALGRLIRDSLHTFKDVRDTRTSVVLSTFKETARIPIDESDTVGG